MPESPKISILIPTTRAEDLERCLISIHAQDFRNYEVLIDGRKGPLSEIRNSLAGRATGDYLVFLDDDTTVNPGWLTSIIRSFSAHPSIAGVSGPSLIMASEKSGRDIFKYHFAKWCYDQFFCGGRQFLPGHFTESGAWTTGASEATCLYEGEVDFLEACNMAYRRDTFESCGGFDTTYSGIGDWSEPDLSFRIRAKGHRLWFSSGASINHHVSVSGSFKNRDQDAKNRLSNFFKFCDRWIKPCRKHTLYKEFIRAYYFYKTLK